MAIRDGSELSPVEIAETADPDGLLIEETVVTYTQ